MIINRLEPPHKHTHICEDNKYTTQYKAGNGTITQTVCLICGFQLGRMTMGKGMLAELNPLLKGE
jgi:hypothetical protein